MSILKKLLSAALAGCLAVLGVVAVPATAATAQTRTVTNLSHLDFLLDQVTPPVVTGHTTYRLEAEPQLLMPWTYADARDNNSFKRVGGGSFDAATGHYSQGAYNADDIARAAVVYLRHWQQSRDSRSRIKAYQLLRSTAYLQTLAGANRGRSVLWIQADGQLNPSAEPVELPDPSDSGPSYWQARTLWAYGEGYAAFRNVDPAFARFLQQRLRLSLAALNRDVLHNYGRYRRADGRRVPAWLIVNGADATAEAVLGLAAYTAAAPADRTARTALQQFAAGIAAMASPTTTGWPYGAILPWAESQSLWHAWASQTSASLARASAALHRRQLLQPAIREAVSFDPTLLTSDGADNGWLPAPNDRVQIAYGVDSRVQSLLAVADVGGVPVAGYLAAMHAAWFFGANRAQQAMYQPATGVTFDGLEADGRINRNSGAESTIHGLLTMLALDAHPQVRNLATSLTRLDGRNGLKVVEAETATTDGTVVTPSSAWTGESSYSGGAYLRLTAGQSATIPTATQGAPVIAEPISWQEQYGSARSRWSQADRRLGTLLHRVGAQGITAVPGALLPQRLPGTLRGGAPLVVRSLNGTVQLDAVLLRPLLSTVTLSGADTAATLVQSAASTGLPYRVSTGSGRTTVRIFDRHGRLVSVTRLYRTGVVHIPAGGTAMLVRRS